MSARAYVDDRQIGTVSGEVSGDVLLSGTDRYQIVNKAYRQRGIFRRLIDEIERAAIARGCVKAVFIAKIESTQAALQRCGYEVAGDHWMGTKFEKTFIADIAA